MIRTDHGDPRRRVVVTGLGVVSSLGIGIEEFWRNLLAGKSGISEIESFDTSGYPVHRGGEVKNFRPEDFIPAKKIKNFGRSSQMAIAATRMALFDAKMSRTQYKNAGIFLGTTMGEIQELECENFKWAKRNIKDVSVVSASIFPTNVISISVAIVLKARNYNFMFPTACSSGNCAIGYAADLIRDGQLEITLAGGVDALSRIAFSGFNRVYAMAPEKCQPFDKNRKGMMLGEGAGVLVLESLEHARRRNAKIYAEVLGYGLSCDAHHMTQPSEEGIVKAIEKALKESGVSKDEMDYISAHGTGTVENDKVECGALKKVFGARLIDIPCSSIKSMLGHTMGAAAAIEAISCCLSIRDGIVPPTINFEAPDEKCHINCVPNKAEKDKVAIVLNNSFAFGGNSACLIFQGY